MWRVLPLLAIPAFLLASATPGPRGDATSVWLTELPTRPIEARLSVAAADVHRPHAPPRHERSTPVPLRELARLEARGDRAGIAASYLVHGDPQQALAHLSHAPASPARDNDRAVAAFLLRRHDEALTLLDAVLERVPRHPQALWNRGLVLRELGLTLLAAAAFEEVAAQGEPGWREEAREQARALRAQAREREEAWKSTRDALNALATTPDASLPLDGARRFPGTARALFYEAVRAAPSAARVTALLPLAEVLDRAYGGAVLTRYTRQVASRDFSRRAPLAAEYARVLRREHPEPAALAERLLAAGEDDLWLGVLVRTPNLTRVPRELEALAQRSEDPWVDVLVEEELARAEQRVGDSWKAKAGQRLRAALATCRANELRVRCLDMQQRMSHQATVDNRLAEAEELARSAWRDAQALGEWDQEALAIRALGQAARFQFRVSPARAYFTEVLERAPSDCAVKNYVHRNLASLAMMRLRPEEARRALDKALECHRPVGLVGAWILADLGRVAPRDSDAEHMQRELAQVDPSREPPGRRVLATLIRARFALNHDVKKGTALLRQTIAEAEPWLATEADARDARSVAYQTLAVSAGHMGAFAEVPGMVAEQLGVPEPERCVLAAAVEAERTVVVARGPEGQLRGHYDATRKEPLGDDLSGLVPRELLALLRGCRKVDVLAATPLDSRAGLLPPELVWRYVTGATRATPSPPRPPLRLVVANVETPASLRLARLPTWESAPPPTGELVELSGLEATPSRVLEAMKQATDIEFHAHGLVDRSLSDAAVIALAPEHDGRYALTVEDLRQVRLEGQPVVLLSACSAARLPSLLHHSSSLPQAFIASGARAVFAATVDIPNSAGRFFQAVRERIHAGAEPAHALHDERMRWLRTEAGAQWVTRVLLYE